jgi:hypothetical protein
VLYSIFPFCLSTQTPRLGQPVSLIVVRKPVRVLLNPTHPIVNRVYSMYIIDHRSLPLLYPCTNEKKRNNVARHYRLYPLHRSSPACPSVRLTANALNDATSEAVVASFSFLTDRDSLSSLFFLGPVLCIGRGSPRILEHCVCLSPPGPARRPCLVGPMGQETDHHMIDGSSASASVIVIAGL